MTTTDTAQISRQRIAELIAREAERLDARTQRSRETYARASAHLAGGVASSYQLRDPWPIYLEGGQGPRVRDVDGNEYWDFHNGFGSMVQGHAHPAIGKAVAERYPLGTHFAAPTEDAIVVGDELARRFGLPKWRYTNSGSESTMDAIRIARAYTGRDTVMKIFGSYHGHHDTVMVSIGVEYDKIGDPDNLASLPYGAGIPQAVVDMTVAVPFNDAGAMERRIAAPGAGGPPARLRHHGGRHDEPRGGPARAGLPRGGPRDHRPLRHRAHLRRGQDGPVHRARRRDGEVRRHPGHGHPRQGARRRPAGRGHRRVRGGHVGRRGRLGVPGGHLQREPADHGRRPGEPARGAHPRGVRAPGPAQRPHRRPGARTSSTGTACPATPSASARRAA